MKQMRSLAGDCLVPVVRVKERMCVDPHERSVRILTVTLREHKFIQGQAQCEGAVRRFHGTS
jgi:hypothetical protein